MDNSRKKSDPARREFISRLEKFRLRMLWRHTVSALARSFLFLPFLTAATLAAARRGVPPLFVALPVAVIVFAVLWLLEAPWRLERCAQLADLGHDGKAPVVSALELYRKAPEGTFDSYIYARGRLAVPDRRPRNAVSPLPWKSAGGSFLAALVFFLLPGGFIAANGATENERSEANMTDASAAIPAEREAASPRSASENAPRTAASNGKSATNSAARSDDAAATASGDGSGDQDPAETSPSGIGEAEHDAESEARKNMRSAAASGAGAADAGEDADREADDGASVGESHRAEKRSSRKRSAAKRRAETPQDSCRLTAFDTDPPAGRDASTKEEHGDKPGDGRGGETGAKKARGTGTAVPVIPLPDSVAGKLGSGSDAVTPGRSRGAADAVPGTMSGENPGTRAPEPPVRHPGFTSQLRKTLPNRF